MKINGAAIFDPLKSAKNEGGLEKPLNYHM